MKRAVCLCVLSLATSLLASSWMGCATPRVELMNAESPATGPAGVPGSGGTGAAGSFGSGGTMGGTTLEGATETAGSTSGTSTPSQPPPKGTPR